MSNPTYICFIDESGDEGEKEGCTKHFVLTGVVLRKTDEHLTRELVASVRDAINKTRKPSHYMPTQKPLHFSEMSHDARRYYCEQIGELPAMAFAVTVNKEYVKNLIPSVAKARLYRYATGLLLTRIVHVCHAAHDEGDTGDGTVEFIFSNRSAMDYNDIKEYIQHLIMVAGDEDRVNYAKVFRMNQVRPVPHKDHPGLQVADGVAGATFHLIEPNGFGMTNREYLTPISKLYARGGERVSNDLMIVPLIEPWGEGIEAKLRDISREEAIFEMLDKKKAGPGPKDPTGSDPAAAREPSPDDEEGDHR